MKDQDMKFYQVLRDQFFDTLTLEDIDAAIKWWENCNTVMTKSWSDMNDDYAEFVSDTQAPKKASGLCEYFDEIHNFDTHDFCKVLQTFYTEFFDDSGQDEPTFFDISPYFDPDTSEQRVLCLKQIKADWIEHNK